MRDTSLVYLIDHEGRVLLGHKRRGMGFGKWNGFGGKIEAGETMRQCAVRELNEECGLSVSPGDLQLVADLYFDQPSDAKWSHGGMVYFARSWTGTPTLSDEMEPRWFRLEELPYDEMWQADKIWLPMLLQGKQLRGTIVFAEDGDTVIDSVFREVHLDSAK
jgi:8-oxo-dGTP diphosphatase